MRPVMILISCSESRDAADLTALDQLNTIYNLLYYYSFMECMMMELFKKNALSAKILNSQR